MSRFFRDSRHDSNPSDFYLFKGRADEQTASLPYTLIRDGFSNHFHILDSASQPEVREKLVQGMTNILAVDGKRERALEILGLCLHHPEINSDTRREIQLLLYDLRKTNAEDIDEGLERGKSLASAFYFGCRL